MGLQQHNLPPLEIVQVVEGRVLTVVRISRFEKSWQGERCIAALGPGSSLIHVDVDEVDKARYRIDSVQ